MKFTFIGAGHIGGASARGIVKGGAVKAQDVTLTAAHPETLKPFETEGFKTGLDNVQAVKGADAVVICVKPWLVQQVLEQIKASLDLDRQIVLCMAAGVTSAQLCEWLGGKPKEMFFVIPNIAIEYCQSVSYIAPIGAVNASLDDVCNIFAKAGDVIKVSEALLPSGIALASCGIAYALKYLKAATEGGAVIGLDKADAQKAVMRTMQGALAILNANGSEPQTEIDKVTTPGGLTLKGLDAMDKGAFTEAVIAGLKASSGK